MSWKARGLAERRQAARDKRSYALYLTAEGAALMRKLKPVLKAHESRMVGKVGEDGRDGADRAAARDRGRARDAQRRAAQGSESFAITSAGIG